MTRRKSRWLVRMVRLLLSVVVLLALLAWWQPRFLLRVLAALNPDVLFFVDTEQPLVALTIDDAPYSALTPLILDVLAKHDAHATFLSLVTMFPEMNICSDGW